MTISGAQYATMRSAMLRALSGSFADSAGVQDAEVSRFFAQFFTEGRAAGVLRTAQQNPIPFAFRAILAATDSDISDFWIQLQTDAANSIALSASRYVAIRDQFLGAVQRNLPVAGPTQLAIGGLYSYMAERPGSVSGFTFTQPAVFAGDFGALAASYGLTVRGYWRGDLGLSGSQGTGNAVWANQSGSHGSIGLVTSGTTNGIGTPGTGLNGRASLIQDGSTQGGKYTNASQVAPGTTNRHKFFIGRLLSGPGATSYIIRSGPEEQFGGNGDIIGALGSGTPNFKWGSIASGSPTPTTPTSTRVINTWYRFSHSICGGANDIFQVGSEVIGPLNTGIGSIASGSTTIGCYNDIGQLKVPFEWLLYLDLEGPYANYLPFKPDADAKSQAFWTSAIGI